MHIIIKKVQVRLVSHTRITAETIYTPRIGRMPRVRALIGKAMRKQSHVLQARQRVGSPPYNWQRAAYVLRLQRHVFGL